MRGYILDRSHWSVCGHSVKVCSSNIHFHTGSGDGKGISAYLLSLLSFTRQ